MDRTSPRSVIPDPATVLATYSRVKVRRLAQSEGPGADALLRVAMGERIVWALEDWSYLLAELDACNDTVEQWLAIRL